MTFARRGSAVLALLSILAAPVLLLSGCGGGSSAPASTPTPAPVALETTVSPSGGGTVQVVPSASKDGKYLAGTNLLLTASPAPGYQFAGWAGGAGGTTNPLSLTIRSDTSVVASFTPLAGAAAATTPTAVALAAPTTQPAAGVTFTPRTATPTATAASGARTTPTSAPKATPTSSAAGVLAPSAAAPTGAAAEGEKANIVKDPLSFKIVENAGVKIALFDNRQVGNAQTYPNGVIFLTVPNGRSDDFGIYVLLGLPGAQVVANWFVDSPPIVRQILPGFTLVGQPVMTKYGGDDAMVEEYQGTLQGKAFHAKAVYIKKTDLVVALIGIGTDQGFKDFGRSVDILAQSITVNQSPLPPTLVGTWRRTSGFSSDNQALNTGKETFSHESETQLTIYPNGTFTEASMSFSTYGNYSGSTGATTDGSDRGRIVVHGTTLSFNYDSGKVWNAEYKFDGGTLVLNGTYYSKVG